MKIPSFLRPFLGAAVGAVIALILYGAYDLASPYLLALLPSSVAVQTEPGTFTEEERQNRMDRVVLQARQLLGRTETGD